MVAFWSGALAFGRQYHELRTVQNFTFDSNSGTAFSIYGRGFFRTTRDSVAFIQGGEERWSDIVTLSSPVMTNAGGYAAVADARGHRVYVYGQNGRLYNVVAESTVLAFSLSENGYLATIVHVGDVYLVEVYNNRGDNIFRRVEANSGIYPIAASLSADGRRLAISYVDATDVQVSAVVSLFYTNRADGARYTDSMYASARKERQIVPVIQFLGNRIIAVSDSAIYGFDLNLNRLWENPLHNRVDALAFARDRVVVALGEPLLGEEGADRGTVLWFNTAGREVATHNFGRDITSLSINQRGNTTVVGAGRIFYGVGASNIIWQHNFSYDVRQMLPLSRRGEFLVVAGGGASVVRVVRVAEEANSVVHLEGAVVE